MRFVFFGLLLVFGAQIAVRTAARLPVARWRAIGKLLALILPQMTRWLHQAEAFQHAFRPADEPARSGMTAAEARRILGVPPGASGEAIASAYRELMRRHHPDQGGSADIASRINAARDRLLREA